MFILGTMAQLSIVTTATCQYMSLQGHHTIFELCKVLHATHTLHTQISTHTHARTHARTHTRTHTHTYAIYREMHVQTYTSNLDRQQAGVTKTSRDGGHML